jgi:hypothetical protein
MTDNVDVVSTTEADLGSDVQTWLDNNSAVTSVDFIEGIESGPNRLLVLIGYTA